MHSWKYRTILKDGMQELIDLTELLKSLIIKGVPTGLPSIFKRLKKTCLFDQAHLLLIHQNNHSFYKVDPLVPWMENWRESIPQHSTSSTITFADFVNDAPRYDDNLDKYVKYSHENALVEMGFQYRYTFPLSVERKFFGILELLYIEEPEDSLATVDLISNFTYALSHQLKKWFDLEEEKARHKEADMFRAAAFALSSSLSTDEVVEKILLQLQQLVPFKTCSVQLLKEEGGIEILEVVGGSGFKNIHEIIGLNFPLGDENPNTVVMTSKKTFIADDITRWYKVFIEKPHKIANIQSWMGVPMIIGNKLIGMIALDYDRAGFYQPHHAKIAEVFAVEAAVALENARLYEELIQRVEELDTVNKQLHKEVENRKTIES